MTLDAWIAVGLILVAYFIGKYEHITGPRITRLFGRIADNPYMLSLTAVIVIGSLAMLFF